MAFGFASSYIALWVWAIFQGLLTLAVFRQVWQLEKRWAKLPAKPSGESLIGTRTPRFSGIDFHSGQSIDSKIFAGKGGVILFLAAYCTACRRLAKSFQRFPVEGLPPIVAFCTGNEQQAAKLGKQLGPQVALLLEGAEDVAAQYHVSNYPTAVVVDERGTISAHSGISSAQELQHLLARSTGHYVIDEELAAAGMASRQSA